MLTMRALQKCLFHYYIVTYQVDGDLRIDAKPGVHANSLFCGGFVSDVVHRQLQRTKTLSLGSIHNSSFSVNESVTLTSLRQFRYK